MKLIGLMAVRNEDWVLGLSLPAAMLFVDHMVVCDHSSRDRTPAILEEVRQGWPGRLHTLRLEDPTWHEAAIRQRLLATGRQLGGSHFATVDADEVLTGNLLPRIRPMFEGLDPGELLCLPWLELWHDLDHYRSDQSPLLHDWMSLGFRDHPGLRHGPHTRDYDLHARLPLGWRRERRLLEDRSQGGVFHLAFANPGRERAKLAWYKMTETLRFPWNQTPEGLNRFYRYDPAEAGLETRAVDPAWWAPYARWRQRVRCDGASWFEEECRRLLAEHGAARFTGLDLPSFASDDREVERSERGG